MSGSVGAEKCGNLRVQTLAMRSKLDDARSRPSCLRRWRSWQISMNMSQPRSSRSTRRRAVVGLDSNPRTRWTGAVGLCCFIGAASFCTCGHAVSNSNGAGMPSRMIALPRSRTLRDVPNGDAGVFLWPMKPTKQVGGRVVAQRGIAHTRGGHQRTAGPKRGGFEERGLDNDKVKLKTAGRRGG
jgi:hypothetical protein